jgi:hypothetical protein
MKTLGLCFLFLSSVLVVNAPAQQQSNAPALNTDKAAIQKWLARGGQTRWPRINSDRSIFSPDDRDSSIFSLYDREWSCAYMRTYRVKREARDSDITRAAGYTKCVPMERFEMKRAVELEVEPSE